MSRLLNGCFLALAFLLCSLVNGPARATVPAYEPPPEAARVYLNPNTGRFWTMDSYEGNNQDPLTLHKYLYCHANPVNMVDPSGYDGNLISTLAAAFWQTSLQVINAASRALPVLNFRFAYTVFRIQQNLWKLEVALTGLTAAAIVTDAGLGWLESSLKRALNNRQIETSINGGPLFERVMGANATGYRAIDHLIPEPDGRVTVVSLGTRSDTHNMTDDEFLRRTEKTILEKAEKISTQRGYKHENGSYLPNSKVSGRITAVGIPETRAHLMNDARMTQMLTRIHQTVSKVRCTTVLLRGWRPGR